MIIANKTTDVEGKIVATVVLDDNSSMIIEAPPEWTDEQILAEAQRVVGLGAAIAAPITPQSILVRLENLYYTMLTQEWTLVLRQYGLIDYGHTVTPQNTGELQNIDYLLKLRDIDIAAYDRFAGEFDRLKAAIAQFGVSLSDVTYRPI